MKNECRMQYGSVLKIVRMVKGYSIKELAEKMKISPTYISEMETQKKQPSVSMLERFAESVDIPLSTIIKLCELLEDEKYDNTRIMLIAAEVICSTKTLEFVEIN